MEREYTITITESDRRKAKHFSNNDFCLVATAIKRSVPGIKSINVTMSYCSIVFKNGERELFLFNEYLGASWTKAIFSASAKQKLFYNRAVVGQSFIMTRDSTFYLGND